MCRSAFLQAHWCAVGAADLFSVAVLALRGLTRYMALFFLGFSARHVESEGMSLDREPFYTKMVRAFLKDVAATAVRLPSQSPKWNVGAERFILSVRKGCSSQAVPRGAGLLRRTLAEHAKDYHVARAHLGVARAHLGLVTPLSAPQTTAPEGGLLVLHQRLGSILFFHQRAA